MIKWVRPSGSYIETNDTDASIEYAAKNGWKIAEEPKPKKKVTPKAVKNDNSVTDGGRSSGKDRIKNG
jgi:hypothetical protein